MHVVLIMMAAIVVMSMLGALGFAGAALGSISSGIPVIVMILAIIVFGNSVRRGNERIR